MCSPELASGCGFMRGLLVAGLSGMLGIKLLLVMQFSSMFLAVFGRMPVSIMTLGQHVAITKLAASG